MTENNIIKKALFRFKSFVVEESKIKRTGAEVGTINIGIDPEGIILKEEKIFELVLKVYLESENKNFSSFVKLRGIFEFKDVIEEEHLETYFYVNAPAILFPYVRSYIAALTALSGLEAVNLPPLHMASLKDELKANVTIIDSSKLDE